MTKVLSLQDDWRHVATIEIAEVPSGADGVSGEAMRHARLVPSEHSPTDARRYDVLVDFGIGARQAAHAASAALAHLQRTADEGRLPGYRLVNGLHWLELSAILG